tara:strand:+ start:169 stop:906 length:738 start_codon:yes stop_codon:yes gene_type:complete
MPLEFDGADAVSPAPVKNLLYGEPGMGKTFSLRSLPKHALPALLIDLDRGGASVLGGFEKGELQGFIPDRFAKVGSKEAPAAYEQVKDKLQSINKDDEIKTIVVDSFTELYQNIMDYVMHKNNKPLDSAPTQPDYGMAMRFCIKFIEALSEMQRHIVVICHEANHTNEVTGITKVTPALTGQLAVKIPGYFDNVLHAKVKGRGEKREYIWETVPNGLYTARTRMQGIEPEIAQDFSLLIKDSDAQ